MGGFLTSGTGVKAVKEALQISSNKIPVILILIFIWYLIGIGFLPLSNVCLIEKIKVEKI